MGQDFITPAPRFQKQNSCGKTSEATIYMKKFWECHKLVTVQGKKPAARDISVRISCYKSDRADRFIFGKE